MKFVSKESIHRALEIMEGLDESKIDAFFDQFSRQQPSILDFIMGNREEMTGEEFDVLLELTFVTYMAFYEEDPEIKEVTAEEVEKIIADALKHIDEMDENDDEVMEEAAGNAMEMAKQPLVFQFLIEDLMAREEEGGFEDEDSSPAFVLPTLQMLMSMLDAGMNGIGMRVV